MPVILSRRDVMKGAAGAALMGNVKASFAAANSDAQPAPWTHGISLLGGLKYRAGFKQFDYINATAPKGGSVRQAAIGTYDSFNMVVAGVKGNLVEGIGLIYDTLMMLSLDEVASAYGLIAEAASYPEDFSWVRFRLREGARWHDQRAVSPEDVLYSLDVFRRLHPQLAAYYRHVVHAEVVGDREVRFQFDAPGIRELPQMISQMTVLPRHWWRAMTRAETSAIFRKRRSRRRSARGPTGSKHSNLVNSSFTNLFPTIGRAICR
jgi:microcin C transport system substrate-binding protein